MNPGSKFTPIQNLTAKIASFNCNKNYRFYIHLHVYYESELKPILELISKSKHSFFLIITISGEKNIPLYNTLNKFTNSYLRILFVKNIGYDILPFFKALSLVGSDESLVAKIHTKKPHDKLGYKWSTHCISSVLLNDEYIEDILNQFQKRKTLHMLGSSKIYKCVNKYMYNNETYCKTILKKAFGVNLSKLEWGFFAGTSFWARKKIFCNLADYFSATSLKYLDNRSSEAGSLFHATERIFGALPMLNEGDLLTVDFDTHRNYEFYSDSSPSVIPITQSFS